MNELHFNFQTMASYRRNKVTRGYNPFDNPEEWEFFRHPFETDEEDDILTDLLFQIRKMTRRLHLFFDDADSHHLETAFYFGLMDSLTEADDYLLGALKYARYCRLEKLFLLSASKELEPFLIKLGSIKEELLSKIRSFGESIIEFNQECHGGNMIIEQYCDLTQNRIPDDMMCALLRAPDFPSTQDNKIILDKRTNFWSYTQNLHVALKMVEDERNIEGACDSSGLDKMLEPVDMLLWNIRGTLLWTVIMKIKWLYTNVAAFANRHNKLVETMCRDAYEEVQNVYAHSKAYARMRDEELPQQCAEDLFLQGRKPTADDVRSYFNTHYRNFILSQNKSQQLFHQYRKQESTFHIEFLNMLLSEDMREDAEDFLFVHTFSKELSEKQAKTERNRKFRDAESSLTSPTHASVNTLEVNTLIVKDLKIDGGEHPRLPECLSIEDAQKLYEFLSKERFIDGGKTPLADFNYLMGASTKYTTLDRPKPIYWQKNKQMLREMLCLAFAPLLENGTSLSTLSKHVPDCFVDKNGKPIELAKNDERQIVFDEMESLKSFFTTILRPDIQS